MNVRQIVLSGGPANGVRFRGELDGDVLYHQTQSPCVNIDVPACQSSGEWNPDFFTGAHWIFHKYEQTGQTALLNEQENEVFEFVETTERFDAVKH